MDQYEDEINQFANDEDSLSEEDEPSAFKTQTSNVVKAISSNISKLKPNRAQNDLADVQSREPTII